MSNMFCARTENLERRNKTLDVFLCENLASEAGCESCHGCHGWFCAVLLEETAVGFYTWLEHTFPAEVGV